MTVNPLNSLTGISNKNWSLFLDRDGVINQRLIDDYVKSADEFQFIPGTLEAIAIFAKLFSRIFIVTNQQGIGKGIMTLSQLEEIHGFMTNKIREHGGRIDKIYFAPQRKEENSFYRKPQIGMALHAKKDFPEIHLKEAVMVGDSLGDMQFGRRAGMVTILIANNKQIASLHSELVDLLFPDLLSFAQFLQKINS